MLSDLSKLKTFLGLSGTNEEDGKLSSILAGVDRAVKNHLGRGRRSTAFTNWPETGSGTEYYDGSGYGDLLLRYSVVTAVASVYLDATGYYGDGPSAFAATTLLTSGTDYVLVRDDGSTSAVGKLRRIGGQGGVSLNDEWHWWPSEVGRGSLSATRGPCWPRGEGNIKVTYTAGYATTAIPADLQLAVHQLCSFVRAGAEHGGQLLGSESLGEYSYSLATNAAQSGSARLADVWNILAHYRDLAA